MTTLTSFATECWGTSLDAMPVASTRVGFTVTAPTGIVTGDEAAIRISPQPSSFPHRVETVVGPVTYDFLQDIAVAYELPTSSEVIGVSVVTGSGEGIEGTPTVIVDEDHEQARIVLHVPRVPRDPTPSATRTTFTIPTVEVALKATGAAGSTIDTRVAGTSATPRTDGSFTLEVATTNRSGLQSMDGRSCWPSDNASAPVMSRTVILPVGTTGPAAPTTVVAVGGPRQARVSWVVPTSDGGTPVTGYTVTASPSGAVVRTGPKVTEADIIGLEVGVAQTFTVTAQNLLDSSSGASSSAVQIERAATAFTDVPVDHAFCGEITWLANQHITTGFPDNSFHPTSPVERQAIAAFLYRYTLAVPLVLLDS